MVCHCSLAGTSACRSCANNPFAGFRIDTVYVTDKILVTGRRTNADRIRAMTDEELANLINRIEPKFCHDGWDYMIGCDEDKDCVMCWLDWLRQEVDNEDQT